MLSTITLSHQQSYNGSTPPKLYWWHLKATMVASIHTTSSALHQYYEGSQHLQSCRQHHDTNTALAAHSSYNGSKYSTGHTTAVNETTGATNQSLKATTVAHQTTGVKQ